MMVILFLLLNGCRSNLEETVENAQPTVTIISHQDSNSFGDGYQFELIASVGDNNHSYQELWVAWYANDNIVCDWQIPDPDGNTRCQIQMKEGYEQISVKVVDPYQSIGIDSISIVIEPTYPPEVLVLSPEPLERYYSDKPIVFQANVFDEEDDLSDLVMSWHSDIDGLLNLDFHIQENTVQDVGRLTSGQHTITFESTDTSGKKSSDSIIIDVGDANNDPNCFIEIPDSGFVGIAGETLSFTAFAFDEDINNALLRVEWESDLDGVFHSSSPSTDGILMVNTDQLRVGNHIITLRVADEIGGVCADTIAVSIGTLPHLEIQSPTDGDVFSIGEEISFSVYATDEEDSSDELFVIMTSHLDGVLIEQSPNALGLILLNYADLTVGEHFFSTIVTDSMGHTTMKETIIRINTPPDEPNLFISPSEPLTNQNLIPNITAIDQDGDVLTFSYHWKKNGIDTPYQASFVSSVPSLHHDATVAGDIWTLEITPSDGFVEGPIVSSTVEIQNSLPVISSLFIDEIIPYNDQILTCSATAIDLDEDIQVQFTWHINGVEYSGPTIDLSTTVVFPMDSVTCQAYVIDEYGESDDIFGSVIVANRPPTEPIVDIFPVNPQGGIDELNCSAYSEDIDGQQVNYHYEWQRNGQTTSFTTPQVPSEVVDSGDSWVCNVFASDGIDDSSVGSSPAVIIESPCTFGECDLFIQLDIGLGMDFQLIDGNDLIGTHFSLENPFYLMSTEVTQAMFIYVMQYDSRIGEATSFGEGDNFPAYYVNWHMAAHYANTISEMMNEELCYECSGSFEHVVCEEIMGPFECTGYSLPTEGEWELAAQSGTSEDFWTGNGASLGGTYSSNTCQDNVFIDDGGGSPSLLNYAWYCGNNIQNGTKMVGQKDANAFGLYDMHGNVWEWTSDWWGCSFPTANGSWCSIENINRSFRGGGWVSTPNDIRATNRNELSPTTRRSDVGFRLRKKDSTSNQ